MDDDAIEILWTGGFDSSFRMCQLSRCDATVRPYYLSDGRRSEPNELRAIETIRAKLLADPRTRARILPLAYVAVDGRRSSEDCATLFGNFRLPLARYTKLRMRREYRAMGLTDVADDTWFCHTPADGVPCGTCSPCRYAIEEGMADRFTPAALERYGRMYRPDGHGTGRPKAGAFLARLAAFLGRLGRVGRPPLAGGGSPC